MALAIALAAWQSAQALQAPAGTFDILIRNGRILDGTGNPWYRADIGIRGDRIVAMGALSEAKATTVVDAADRYVTPGFIDVHSHAGPGLLTDDLKHGQPRAGAGHHDGAGEPRRRRPGDDLPASAPPTRSRASAPTSACSCRTARSARW